jgi:penicillin-binding protein 1A
MPMEAAAEAAVAESMKSIDGRRKALAVRRAAAKRTAPLTDASPVQGALIALDPVTGSVRAMVGGRDFGDSHFNRAVQAHRQPGSAFKPFVYAAALEAGYGPATVIDHLDDPIATPQGAWTPEDEHSTATSMSLRTGLRTSSNRAAVQLLQQVGIPRVVGYAKQMGVGDVPSVPSLALGSGEVTLQSMTAAYAAFANHGLVPRPVIIRRVEDRDGRVLYESQPHSTQAITETTAFLMATMMADVINAGTAAGARRLGFTLPAAGKTGTTNNFNDAWFIGFTPKLVTGVWVGFDEPRTILPNGFAADLAVPMWTTFMKAATHGDRSDWFTPPVGVTTARVCRLSGKLATEGCEDTYVEYFARNAAPTAYCDLHPTHGFWGRIAGLFAGRDNPEPSRATAVDVPPAPASASTGQVDAPIDPPAPLPPEMKTKRGFWSRVFGGRQRKEN